jgi:hypothetical protein
MIVDAPWYVPNMVIRTYLQTPTVKDAIHHYSLPQCTPKQMSSEPYGATPQNQAIAKTPAKRSAYKILSVTVLFVVITLKV